MNTEFLLALLSIIGINLVLAGDNAVVIALAARNLPATLQRRAIVLGTVAAVVLRVALTLVVVQLLEVDYLKLIGGALLLWIAYKLAVDDNEDHNVSPADDLRNAVITILMADLIMSLDNVLAVAAQADGKQHEMLLIGLGLLISIPIVMGGAAILLALIKRFPIIVWLGAWLVAYTGLELMVAEPVVHNSEVLHELGNIVERLVLIAIAIVILVCAFYRKRISKHNSLLKAEGSGTDV